MAGVMLLPPPHYRLQGVKQKEFQLKLVGYSLSVVSVCLSFNLSVFLSVCLYVRLFVCLCVCLSVYLYVCLSACLPFCLSV